jgi:hypothetical protein
VIDLWCYHQDGFDDDIVHLLLELLLYLLTKLFLDMIHHNFHASFTGILRCFLCVLHKALMVLVNGIIGEMHVQVLDIHFRWLLVRHGGKSGQSVVVDVNPWRVDAK